MTTEKHKVTSKQMVLLTFLAQTGVSMLTLPTVIARAIGHDGWITIILAGILSVILGALIVHLLNRYRDKSIYEINTLLYGKIIGYFLNIILIIYLLLAAANSVRAFSVFLEITIMPRTPIYVIAPFVMLPSIYMVGCGLKYVVRFKYVSCVSYMISFLYLLLLLKDYRISFLMPIGEAGMLEILKSVKKGFFAFLGLELVAFLYPEVTDKQNLMKWHVFAIILSTLFSLLIVVTATSLFGANFLKVQTLPLFNMARVYKAPVFERLDLYLITVWFVVMGCSMRAYMIAAYYSLGKVFKIKDNKSMVLLFFLLLILLSRIPKDFNQVFLFREIISQIGIGVYIFLVLCLCISYFKTKGVKKND
ncbi:GerAB/ArcD/ProY family transporter [Clostridium sp. YIM B02505]|uniref:GerAB/ArcD/ProY family transporter n=1 Tax=Clostridium yunnanense TaxID=2800325 RepID=A0ABS1EP68_9CLOT|nr:GerAB/ArcD/ProY family transporter [Clostridium yunnanense]MBK1811157.1 GerAB/ArcD/ProY family transporter [Clostridium yunnanense]